MNRCAPLFLILCLALPALAPAEPADGAPPDPTKFLLEHGFFETTYGCGYDNAKRHQYGLDIYSFTYTETVDGLQYEYVFYEPEEGDTNEFVQVIFKDDSGNLRYFIKVNRGEKGERGILVPGNVRTHGNKTVYLWR